MEQIGIRMLGEFVVVMDGREICGPDCRRGQMWNLLQYLATFRAREIPAAELQCGECAEKSGLPAAQRL